MNLRQGVKRAAEQTLVWSGAAALSRSRLAGRALVLAYHNILPDGFPPIGDLPNHLPLSLFRDQLDALQDTHDVVPLADVLDCSGECVRPRVAITFDDAYAGALRYGINELVSRGLPGTAFVAPAFVGGKSFWWDALAASGEPGLDPGFRARALGDLQGDDTSIRAWARERGEGVAVVPEVACAASEEEILRIASEPGITVGSHSWSHPDLTRVTPDRLIAELAQPLAWLRERIVGHLPWIAYPYGSFDVKVAEAAARAGYVGGLAISGGWIPPVPQDLLGLPRLNIPPGLSRFGFILRVAGVVR